MRKAFFVAIVGMIVSPILTSCAAPTSHFTPATQNFSIVMSEVEVIMKVTEEVGGGFRRWEPAVLVVNKGDTVNLKVTNPQGHRHSLVLPDFGVDTRALEPLGGEATVKFTADKAGVFQYMCGIPWGGEGSLNCDRDHKRQVGYLVVLER